MDFIITFFKNYGFFSLFGLFVISLLLAWFIKYRKKRAVLKSILTALILVFIIFIFSFFLNAINSKHIGFGYCNGRFKVLACGDNILWGMDEFKSKNDSKIYRIQGLNLDNGKKLFRKLIDHPFEYIGYKKHLMWAYTEEGGKNVIGMDPSSGKERLTTDEYNLMKRVPEFSKIIYRYSSGAHSPLAALASKNGLRIEESEIEKKPGGYSVKKIDSQNDYELSAQKFSASNGNVIAFGTEEKQKLQDAKGDILNNELIFYSGAFLLFDERAEKLVTLSYTGPEKKEFILRYLSTDGNLVWKVKQSDLKVGDLFNSEPAFEKVFIYKEQLIFVFEGFVFSLDSFNGQLNWLTRV